MKKLLFFQNYCLNLETLIINQDNYNSTLLKTPSERIFFKWLKELGAIRFDQASDLESTKDRFTEEASATTGPQRYNQVVKYIGDIDIVNNVK